ncbi:2-phosphosulfolactate phosphatase [Candidatus Entotheonellaceae bacterium PAL068K]
MTFDQQEFDIRCEWGEHGIAILAPISDVLIIIDVLSFSTSVDVAVTQGAIVFPYGWRDDTALAYAGSVGATLADPGRNPTRYSLSPASLTAIPNGTRIVLPSPNGSTLTVAAKPTPVLAGCLRNARAIASMARTYGRKIAVIPAGERWKGDGSLRPSFEDLIGAGAIISHLNGRRSPEALVALAAFRAVESALDNELRQCSSGKELIERGLATDVMLAAQLNVSACAPLLVDEAYIRAEV